MDKNKISATSLRCEYMINPVGINIKIPRLSWEIVSSKRGTLQTAYQIMVANNIEDLNNAANLIWDTNKVQSDKSVNCEYNGLLESRKRYYWKVRIWDESQNVSSWSEPAFWEMGLHETDWKAKWIEPEQRPTQREVSMSFAEMEAYRREGKTTNYDMLNPCQMLRKEFGVKTGIKKVRIYSTAHGIYRLELNGRKVGDIEFTPEVTAYDKYLQYNVFDVTELLNSGKNAIGAVIADGWYAGRIGMMGESCNYGDMLALLLQLEVEYEDGTYDTIVSDESFRSSTGPLLYSDIFIGERYDAKLEDKTWSTASFDDSAWSAVNVKNYGYSNLVCQYGEPVRAVKEIKPIGIITTPKGEKVIDLGQNIAGRMRMKVSGPAGSEVILEHSEILDENRNFILNIDGRNKDQKDIYILKGNGEEIYEPWFTFHGFRYVRITGYPGELNPKNFMGIALSSDLRVTGSFECSHAGINQLQSNIEWSQRSNMLSIPTDCPQRERAGWTGDIQVFTPTACFNMDVDPFLTRWMRNLILEQRDDGQVPIVIPYFNNYKTLQNTIGQHSSAGWGDAAVIIPWVLYNKYGDLRILEESYDTMTKWIEYIKKQAEEGLPEKLEGDLYAEHRERQKYLWNTGFHFGDWLTPSVSVNFETGELDVMKSAYETMELVPTYFYAYSTELAAKIAGILGKTEDQKHYTELNRKIREAFAAEFLSENGRLKRDLQGIYVLALQMKMVPDNIRDKVFNRLIELIIENDYKLDTGFVSVPFLMDILYQNGQLDIAYKLLYQTECPSWLYEVEKGATTIWEAWQAIMPNGKVTNVSYNHYAYGCVGDWLYRVVAGLGSDEPGYKHIVIKPEPDDKMTFAKAKYHSVYGEITSEWEKNDSKMRLDVKIPPNTTASVWLPGAKLEFIQESGKNTRNSEDIRNARQIKDKVFLDIGSGEYVFEYIYS